MDNEALRAVANVGVPSGTSERGRVKGNEVRREIRLGLRGWRGVIGVRVRSGVGFKLLHCFKEDLFRLPGHAALSVFVILGGLP